MRQVLILSIICAVCTLVYAQSVAENEKSSQNAEKERTSGENQRDREEEGEQERPKENENAKEQEQSREEDNQEGSTAREFYRDPGYQLLPRNREFSVTNILTGRIFYDSNVSLSPEPQEDFGVMADFKSIMEYKKGSFRAGLTGEIAYEHYTRNGGLSDYTALGDAYVKYKTKLFEFEVRDTVLRRTTISSLEVNSRSVWYENQFRTKAGIRRKRWLGEINFYHNYSYYQDLDRRYQQYGPGVLLGYKVNKLLYVTGEYGLDFIDYREVAVFQGEFQEDTMGHRAVVGAELRITEALNFKLLPGIIEGRANMGLQYRASRYFWSFYAGLLWNVTPKLDIELDFYRATIPSLIVDYNLWTSISVGFVYKIRRDLATKIRGRVSHIEPERGEDRIGYYLDLTLTWKLAKLDPALKGVQLEPFYYGEFVVTNRTSQDYDRHRLGLALNIIF